MALRTRSSGSALAENSVWCKLEDVIEITQVQRVDPLLYFCDENRIEAPEQFLPDVPADL